MFMLTLHIIVCLMVFGIDGLKQILMVNVLKIIFSDRKIPTSKTQLVFLVTILYNQHEIPFPSIVYQSMLLLHGLPQLTNL